MMHHADLDFDLTTGLRFHPIEIMLSMGIKISAICVFGPPVLSVLVFEIILNGMAMFNHGNIKISTQLDRFCDTLWIPSLSDIIEAEITKFKINFQFLQFSRGVKYFFHNLGKS